MRSSVPTLWGTWWDCSFYGDPSWSTAVCLGKLNAYLMSLKEEKKTRLFLESAAPVAFNFLFVCSGQIACGILVPCRIFTAVFLQWKTQSPNHWTATEFPLAFNLKWRDLGLAFYTNSHLTLPSEHPHKTKPPVLWASWGKPKWRRGFSGSWAGQVMSTSCCSEQWLHGIATGTTCTFTVEAGEKRRAFWLACLSPDPVVLKRRARIQRGFVVLVYYHLLPNSH